MINLVQFDHTWVWKPDEEIREEVEDQLYWSPFVDSDDIHVAVEDGVVTLRGSVDTWSERSAAEENALDAGAKDVRNRLGVTYRFFGPAYPYWDGYSPFAPFEVRTDLETREAGVEHQQ